MAALRHKKMKVHKAKGGAVNEHEYNAVGAPEMAEAHDKKESFKKGGAKKKKGGAVEEGKSKHRPDKKPRRASGGAVLSAASKKTAESKDVAGQGHEGDGPKGEDPDRGCYKSGGWIKSAITHRGALTKSAKAAGESVHKFAEEHKHASGKTGARARLALTLGKLRHKKD
ncbi:MAG: hypothetical protein KGL39_37420 [Patescibacteria group bacterium]|nr:hypothetical protein [Patescibacteria group bacterium]